MNQHHVQSLERERRSIGEKKYQVFHSRGVFIVQWIFPYDRLGYSSLPGAGRDCMLYSNWKYFLTEKIVTF